MSKPRILRQSRWSNLIGKAGADLLAFTIGPALLRLSLGRRPSADERGAFRRALRTRYIDDAREIPPLIRGLLVLPEARRIMRLAVGLAWYHERGRGGGDPFADRVTPLGVPGVPDLTGNLFTAWTGPKLGFLHFEKCGGIAVMCWLSEQFHPDQIDPDPVRSMPPHLWFRAPCGLSRDIARYPLLWGHYGLPALERIDPERFIFTFLRDPRARIVSLYNYWRSVDPALLDPAEGNFTVAAAHRHDLLGFLRGSDPFIVNYLDNFYVRRLTGRYRTSAAHDPLHANPRVALTEAIAALDRIGFVGITERMDESVARLAKAIGAVPPGGKVRGNVAAENHTDPSGWFRAAPRAEITPEVAAELDRLTTLDRALYAEALGRFDGRRGRARVVAAA